MGIVALGCFKSTPKLFCHSIHDQPDRFKDHTKVDSIFQMNATILNLNHFVPNAHSSMYCSGKNQYGFDVINNY